MSTSSKDIKSPNAAKRGRVEVPDGGNWLVGIGVLLGLRNRNVGSAIIANAISWDIGVFMLYHFR